MKRTVQGLKKRCAFGCIYCFTHEDYETNGQSVIDEDELKQTEMIQPFCDYDVFACEHCEWEKEISEYARYGKIVSFATKAFISEEKAKTLSEINKSLMNKGAFLHVGISITTVRLIEEIEPRTASYEKRVESIKNLNKYSIPCSVIIRPLLPVLTVEEIEKIVDDTRLFCNNYIFGPLYLNTEITKYLQNKGIEIIKRTHNVNWLNGQPEKIILDSHISNELEKKLIEYCNSKEKEIFDSNDSAVENIRRKIMMQDVQKLKELIDNCYGNLSIRSSAMLMDENGKKYYGVTISTYAKEASMTCISNAICNAVTEGARSFGELLVYIDSNDNSVIRDIISDGETRRLLKEFHILSFKVIYVDGKIDDMYLE